MVPRYIPYISLDQLELLLLISAHSGLTGKTWT